MANPAKLAPLLSVTLPKILLALFFFFLNREDISFEGSFEFTGITRLFARVGVASPCNMFTFVRNFFIIYDASNCWYAGIGVLIVQKPGVRGDRGSFHDVAREL